MKTFADAAIHRKIFSLVEIDEEHSGFHPCLSNLGSQNQAGSIK